MSEEDKAVEVYNQLGGNHIADFLSEEDLDGCELNDDDNDRSDSDRSDTDDDALQLFEFRVAATGTP